eukprot:scaffold287361_cov28-Attheya_sp.AAC.2
MSPMMVNMSMDMKHQRAMLHEWLLKKVLEPKLSIPVVHTEPFFYGDIVSLRHCGKTSSGPCAIKYNCVEIDSRSS